MRVFLFSVLMIAAAMAEPETAADWVTALTKTYTAQHGYLATYHSEGEGKALDATVALDFGSGMAISQMTAIKNGRNMSGRFWTTESGEIFVDANGRRAYYPSSAPEIGALKQLFPDSRDITPVAVPGFLLTVDSFGQSLKWSNQPQPDWAEAASDLKLGQVTPETVTFETKEYGQLTIDRKTGVLKRQFLTAPDGEKRILEQTSFKPNPGNDVILEISSKWKVDGAETLLQPEKMAAVRLSFFQSLVTGMEEGNMDQPTLVKLLADGKTALRNTAKYALQDRPDSVVAKADWKALITNYQVLFHKSWLERTPEKDRKEEEFNAFLHSQKGRDSMVETLTRFVLTEAKPSRSLKSILFGEGKSLSAKTEPGKKAVSSIETALAQAVVEVLVVPKMNELWGDPKKAD